MYDEENRWNNVRKRNLRISIAKGLITEHWSSERLFSKAELKEVFRFKVRDFVSYAEDFFHKSNEAYIQTPILLWSGPPAWYNKRGLYRQRRDAGDP